MTAGVARDVRPQVGATACHTTGAMQALRHRFTVASNSRCLVARLDVLLRPMRAADGGTDHRYDITVGADEMARLCIDGVEFAAVVGDALTVEWLLWHVNQSAAVSVAGQVALHAGAVRSGDIAFVLPGPSGAGKSSLVAALVDAGLGYLSDELVVLEGDGTLVGYRKPLALRPGAQEALPHWRPAQTDAEQSTGSLWLVDPEQVAPNSAAAPCRPGLVVAPRFVAGASTTLTPLTAPQGLFELVGNSVRVGTPDLGHVEALSTLARRCRCYRLEFGDLDEARRTILDLVP